MPSPVTTTRQVLLDELLVRVRDVVERCRQIERTSAGPHAAEALLAARVLEGRVEVLVEAEGGDRGR